VRKILYRYLNGGLCGAGPPTGLFRLNMLSPSKFKTEIAAMTTINVSVSTEVCIAFTKM